MSLLLPCNVVVEDVGHGTKVSAVGPLGLMADPAFAELGSDISTRLRNAIDAVAAGAGGHTGVGRPDAPNPERRPPT